MTRPAATLSTSSALLDAPELVETLRKEPFRIFFPLAFVIGAAGVVHWVLLAGGAIDLYLAQFHAVSQMQGFMLALACGFLLTALPKRTQTAPASWIEIGALLVLVPAVSLAALFDSLAAAETAYALALLVVAQFAVRRFAARSAGRRPPASFTIVPVGLLAGLGGAALIIAATRGAPGWTMVLGRSLVLEGVFSCLVLGIGAFFFSLALRGEAPPDLTFAPRDVIRGAAYALAGLVSIGSLFLQDLVDVRAGLLLRAAVFVGVFVSASAHRLPSRPGLNRRLIWLAVWAIPLGLVAAAIVPAHRIAAMHVAYVGGFGLLALTVATHVALGHTGFDAQQSGRPWPVAVFGALFVVAAGMRATAVTMPDVYFAWLGVAASIWLAGAVVWAAYLLPKMWRVPAG
jgi:uncharacterized protein involved in response to NO